MNSLESLIEIYNKKIEQGILLQIEEMKADYVSDFYPAYIEWYTRLDEFSPYQVFIQNQNYDEIIFHRSDLIQTCHGQKIETHEIKSESISLETICWHLITKHKLNWNYSHPFVSFKLYIKEHEFRATMIHQSLLIDSGPKLFLRRIKNEIINLEDFPLHYELSHYLLSALSSKKNILISGPTGSGKTTFLSALLKKINREEHVVVLEDVSEIRAHPNYTYFLAQNETGKSLKDYCSYALRLRPDRIILGELRSYEAHSFVLAMNNGHGGLMSTIHAHSAPEAISRLALLFSLYSKSDQINYNLCFKLICDNVDLVIQMEDKKIIEVIRIIGSEEQQVLYEQIYSAV